MTVTDLPNSIPIFPLQGAVLLPTGNLPLHIFEPRYLSMVDDALRTSRLIGMIQTKADNKDLYKIGCIGRITSFEEIENGRYIINLTGISRFNHESDEITPGGYRRASINHNGFQNDQTVENCLSIDREKFNGLIKAYFEHHSLDYNIDIFNEATDHKLITCLSMICPFKPLEKQALLEASCCRSRAEMFMTMLEIESHDKPCCSVQ